MKSLNVTIQLKTFELLLIMLGCLGVCLCVLGGEGGGARESESV